MMHRGATGYDTVVTVREAGLTTGSGVGRR